MKEEKPIKMQKLNKWKIWRPLIVLIILFFLMGIPLLFVVKPEYAFKVFMGMGVYVIIMYAVFFYLIDKYREQRYLINDKVNKK
jgi:predicted acyltransferase